MLFFFNLENFPAKKKYLRSCRLHVNPCNCRKILPSQKLNCRPKKIVLKLREFEELSREFDCSRSMVINKSFKAPKQNKCNRQLPSHIMHTFPGVHTLRV